MLALHPQQAAPAPPQLNAKLNPLDLGRESPSETEKPSPPPPDHLHIADAGRAAVPLLLRRLAVGTGRRQLRQYFWPLFPPGFWGWAWLGLGLASREGGRLSFTGSQSGECSKTMILICVDQSKVKTVGRTDIDPPELNPVTVWHHPKSNILRNERHERPGRESLGGGV